MTGDSESFGESRSQSRHDRIIDQRPRKHDFQEPPERRGGLGAGLIICAVGNDPSKESRLRRLREVWISRLKMKRAATRSDCWLSAASASGKEWSRAMAVVYAPTVRADRSGEPKSSSSSLAATLQRLHRRPKGNGYTRNFGRWNFSPAFSHLSNIV